MQYYFKKPAMIKLLVHLRLSLNTYDRNKDPCLRNVQNRPSVPETAQRKEKEKWGDGRNVNQNPPISS